MVLTLLLACRPPAPDDTATDDTAPVDTATDDTAAARSPIWMCASGETMRFDPAPVYASAPVTITVTTPTAAADPLLDVTGPGEAAVQPADPTGEGPVDYAWAVTELAPGSWFVRFLDGGTERCSASMPVAP